DRAVREPPARAHGPAARSPGGAGGVGQRAAGGAGVPGASAGGVRARSPPGGGRFLMHSATALILAALLLEHGVRVAGDLLNLRTLDPLVASDFRYVYDRARYHRAQAYTRARLRLGLVTSTGELAVLLGFWLLGGFGWLDDLARRGGFGAVGTALLFVGGLLLGRAVLGLPAAWWSTF